MDFESRRTDYEVGVGRFTVGYEEPGRHLRFNMEHENGPGRGVLHICVEPAPRWYDPENYSDIGPVSDSERLHILHNIRTRLKERLYTCVFVDRDGNLFPT